MRSEKNRINTTIIICVILMLGSACLLLALQYLENQSPAEKKLINPLEKKIILFSDAQDILKLQIKFSKFSDEKKKNLSELVDSLNPNSNGTAEKIDSLLISDTAVLHSLNALSRKRMNHSGLTSIETKQLRSLTVLNSQLIKKGKRSDSEIQFLAIPLYKILKDSPEAKNGFERVLLKAMLKLDRIHTKTTHISPQIDLTTKLENELKSLSTKVSSVQQEKSGL